MADIKTRLILDNKQFNTAMNVSTGLLKGFANVAKTTAVAGVALGTAFGALTLRQTGLITRLEETRQKLGVNVEFLQKFRYAANQSGVSVETADMALQRFTRRLSEAANGGGEAYAALRELGISARDSGGRVRDVESVMNDVADAMSKTTSESDRVRLAFKLFDSEGVSLVNTLMNGSAGLQFLYDDAQKLGAVLSTTATRGVKAFSDQLTRLSTLVSGVMNQIVSALAPALEELTRRFTNYLITLAESRGGFEELGKVLATKIVGVVIKIIQGFETVANIVIFIINKLAVFGSVIADIWNSISSIVPGMEKMEDIAGRLRQSAEDDLIAPIDLSGTISQLKQVQDDINTISSTGVSIDITGGASQQKYNAVFRMLEKVFDPRLVSDLWYTFQTEGVLSIDTIKAGFETVLGTELFQRLGQALANASIGFKGLGDTLEQGLVTGITMFEDSLANAIRTGKLSFSDLGAHIRQVLAKALVQKFITGPLLSMFKLPGLAAGGPAQAGKPYIVGEEGPELFVPKTSGTVVPNGQMANGSGVGGAAQVTYNINAVDAMSFKQMVARDPEFIYSVTQVGARRLPR